MRNYYEPRLEEQQRKIAELKAVQDDLLDFKEKEEEVNEQLRTQQELVSQQQATHEALIQGIERGQDQVWIGESKMFRFLQLVLPPGRLFNVVNDWTPKERE